MRKYLVRGCTLLVLLGVAGCGGGERDGLINETIALLNRATTVIGNIKNGVVAGMKTAESEKRKIKAEDFESIMKDLIPEFKDVGTKMQMVKRQIDAHKEGVTEEQRKALAEKFATPTRTATAALQEEQKQLHAVLQRAQSIDADAVKDLKQKLTEAQGEFETIAKLR